MQLHDFKIIQEPLKQAVLPLYSKAVLHQEPWETHSFVIRWELAWGLLKTLQESSFLLKPQIQESAHGLQEILPPALLDQTREPHSD